jgi:exosortase/archaeosortase family protein
MMTSLLLLGANWTELAADLSYSYIVSLHLAPWGVLGLSALMCWHKRRHIRSAMELPPSLPSIVAGAVLLGLAFAVPLSTSFFLLRLLVAWVGLFAICFGQAALVPLILLTAYAFTIYFPILVNSYLAAGFIDAAVAPVAWLARLSGLHIVSGSQTFQFHLPSGQPIVLLVASACAGPATTAVFTVIFVLMMLDLPLPWSRAIPVLLFGLAGTWLQNVIRIVIILACGYFLGINALETAHYWTVYIIFPLWYLLFSIVYFRVAKTP